MVNSTNQAFHVFFTSWRWIRIWQGIVRGKWSWCNLPHEPRAPNTCSYEKVAVLFKGICLYNDFWISGAYPQIPVEKPSLDLTWLVWNPVNNGIFTISTGVGFLFHQQCILRSSFKAAGCEKKNLIRHHFPPRKAVSPARCWRRLGFFMNDLSEYLRAFGPHTVDGRNPAPPEIYQTLYAMG